MKITSQLNNVIKLFETNLAVNFKTNPGNGANIVFPQGFSNKGWKSFVLVSDLISAQSLTVHQQLLNPNLSVGYADYNNINYTPDNQIIYVTGKFLQYKILEYFPKTANIKTASQISKRTPTRDFRSGTPRADLPIDFCDIIIIDQVQLGSIESEIITSLWTYAFNNNVKIPKLLIINSSLGIYNINTATDYKVFPPIEGFKDEYTEYSIEYIGDKNNLINSITDLSFNIHSNNDNKNILIFVPSSNYIDILESSLKNKLSDNYLLIPLKYGTSDNLSNIYKDTSDTFGRKIIIVTSITLDLIPINNVGYVIDCMLEEKYLKTWSGGSRFTTTYISKETSDQRSQRINSNDPNNICYRMCSQETYLSLNDKNTPEYLEVALYPYLLDLIEYEITPQVIHNNQLN